MTTIHHKTSAAKLLSKRLAATAGEKTQPIADSFAQAIGKQLEERGIANVPGLPVDDSQPEWFDLAIEHARRHKKLESQREVRRQAEEVAQTAPQTAAGIVSAAIVGRRDHAAPIPLNGAGVLRAALSGVGNAGTINGAAR